ncbi:GxxExxY protein [Desulfoferrobacter suflitae]|uniref:GxxExxY protein n=1 Tax=Desulfoferrobacter suflitae TaxID=2865782 RepID=UPI0021641A42|nr:GxxExxY protein [Desulfoferrobacter suflitae]MCK8604075.1 GxxExxY protein [Desulfoferrobacter suflitae]
MNTNEREYIESDLTYKVVGCAMAVVNVLGHGLREKTYERALCVEFENQGLSFQQQHIYPIYYRNQHIDDYIPDLEVESRLIVEVKTVDRIVDEHIGQVLNYLRISDLEAGVILNFKHPKLEWKKIVLQQGRKAK